MPCPQKIGRKGSIAMIRSFFSSYVMVDNYDEQKIELIANRNVIEHMEIAQESESSPNV
jgi:hypothetical protein